MGISTNEAKLALDAVENSRTIKNVGQTRSLQKPLQNV